VPRAVLVAAGVVYGVLGLTLLLSGIVDLIDRVREAATLALELGTPAATPGPSRKVPSTHFSVNKGRERTEAWL
jgi:hypothetical protein